MIFLFYKSNILWQIIVQYTIFKKIKKKTLGKALNNEDIKDINNFKDSIY